MAVDGDLFVAVERHDQVGREVAGNIDIAALQQQPLGGRLRHVAQDHAPHTRRAVAIMGIRVEYHRLVGLPAAQPERPRAGAFGLQPCRAQVAVLLMGHHQLTVHYRSDAGRERV